MVIYRPSVRRKVFFISLCITLGVVYYLKRNPVICTTIKPSVFKLYIFTTLLMVLTVYVNIFEYNICCDKFNSFVSFLYDKNEFIDDILKMSEIRKRENSAILCSWLSLIHI